MNREEAVNAPPCGRHLSCCVESCFFVVAPRFCCLPRMIGVVPQPAAHKTHPHVHRAPMMRFAADNARAFPAKQRELPQELYYFFLSSFFAAAGLPAAADGAAALSATLPAAALPSAFLPSSPPSFEAMIDLRVCFTEQRTG
jgi:hypothetical protein